jgi:hypothetical protein
MLRGCSLLFLLLLCFNKITSHWSHKINNIQLTANSNNNNQTKTSNMKFNTAIIALALLPVVTFAQNTVQNHGVDNDINKTNGMQTGALQGKGK